MLFFEYRLYIDQPSPSLISLWNFSSDRYISKVGVGYSHGTLEVTGTKEAAEAVWNMLQIFFADPKFSSYAKNDFAIWTESYVLGQIAIIGL